MSKESKTIADHLHSSVIHQALIWPNIDTRLKKLKHIPDLSDFNMGLPSQRQRCGSPRLRNDHFNNLLYLSDPFL